MKKLVAIDWGVFSSVFFYAKMYNEMNTNFTNYLSSTERNTNIFFAGKFYYKKKKFLLQNFFFIISIYTICIIFYSQLGPSHSAVAAPVSIASSLLHSSISELYLQNSVLIALASIPPNSYLLFANQVGEAPIHKSAAILISSANIFPHSPSVTQVLIATTSAPIASRAIDGASVTLP